MARFLKIVCNTLIVLAVAIAVALLLPPIMGVTTTIIDNQGIRSNLPVGSVTYSRKVNSDNLQKGDLVLVESKNEAYEYTVVSVDVVAKKMIVKNAFDKSAEEKELKVTSGVSRVSFTIPFIGFAVVAMQTVEGMIVIGLIVLFIIILYILSEVWKKKPEEEEAVKADREKSGKERKTPSAPSGVSSVVSASCSETQKNKPAPGWGTRSLRRAAEASGDASLRPAGRADLCPPRNPPHRKTAVWGQTALRRKRETRPLRHKQQTQRPPCRGMGAVVFIHGRFSSMIRTIRSWSSSTV